MKTISLLLLSISAHAAQLMSGIASSNGVWVNYETKLEPSSPPIQQHGGGTLTENQLIKRHICNFDNQTYFGYDLTIEPSSGGRYKLRFAPLTITPQKMSEIFKEVSHWTPLPLPGSPVTTEAGAGETIALDLFVNSSTGQKVTDYLTIRGGNRPNVQVTGTARDFSLDDVPLELSAPRVVVDGAPAESIDGRVSGQSVWIDLPHYGRFVFALAPRPELGLVRAGEIRGTKMSWKTNGMEFAITTDKPIAPGSRAYNLYVLYVASDPEHFRMSAGSKPEVAIRKN